MSRFKGWTGSAVSKYAIEQQKEHEKKEEKPKKQNFDYVSKITIALKRASLEYETEYKFIKDRRFRFDIALPKYQIAIEFEGGIFARGRHTRPLGYANDCKKYNLATMHGWKLLRYTPMDAKKANWTDNIVDDVKRIIDEKKLKKKTM